MTLKYLETDEPEYIVYGKESMRDMKMSISSILTITVMLFAGGCGGQTVPVSAEPTETAKEVETEESMESSEVEDKEAEPAQTAQPAQTA